ncbi:GDP-mannose 4,6-dehydratase [Bacillus licheniformis]|nr:GDP-mannose 4,6-dehydratase [Bacillus licheniformis]
MTGGCGFIGSHIAEQLLKENYRVSILDNLTTGHRSNIDGLPIDFMSRISRSRKSSTSSKH